MFVRQRSTLHGSQTASPLHSQTQEKGTESNKGKRRQEEREEGVEAFWQGERKGQGKVEVALISVDPGWYYDYRLIPDKLLDCRT